ncbi:hypothetical protein IEQ44_08015 [Nocardioides sp. Y6]|uniref:Uncharacterized protein n=1 Tax=Nocardioides malaquae TaxID=2773426 RepID=A0ABR9RSP8_9ACTN|nr:DUF5682 family protein [Nocardioides malaquae]MBE7324595.1 hypothetical protein [Nocardioides malaquae]
MARSTSGAAVDVLGIRHHGPGSARSVLAALSERPPDLLLVEGPPELDGIVALAGDEQMCPPVAALVYAPHAPQLSAFYPFAEFSPEWVAIRWALTHGVEVRFLDLPATHVLGLKEQELQAAVEAAADEATDEAEGEVADEVEVDEVVERLHLDPIGMLAAAAGYDDPERWWEDAVEQRHEAAADRFDAVREAMAEVRARDPRPDDDPRVVEDQRREAWMRRVLRAAMKEVGDEGRIAVVCGAMHAPVLVPESFPPATRDNALVKGLPKVKVAAAWAPWTSARLSLHSGYGAGVSSPGWYQHLFAHWLAESGLVESGLGDGHPDSRAEGAPPRADVATTWLVRVAHELRRADWDASTASVVEATRLAHTLAALRGRPSVGLAELDDAAEVVLCEGHRAPLDAVHRRVVVGEELGQVPDSAPVVPLTADLTRQQKALRMKVSATAAVSELDLRKPNHLARSVLLHRLELLGVDWGERVATSSTGTFKEAWSLEWRPELVVDLVVAGVWGTTVETAAAGRVADRAAATADLATLATLVQQSLVADLPEAVRAVLAALEERAALQHDVPALLRTVEPLATTCRYGDVRGVDTGQVRTILETMVVRACVGLPTACASLDDDAATQLRTDLDGAQRGLALLAEEELDREWYAALAAVAAPEHVHGTVAGRAARILLDAGQWEVDEVAATMSRRLSRTVPAPVAAAWLTGFLAGDATLLVHDATLLALVDDWVSSLTEGDFDDLLPLVRRSFADWSPAERRALGTRLAQRGRAAQRPVEAGIRLDHAWPGIGAVARLVGWPRIDETQEVGA